MAQARYSNPKAATRKIRSGSAQKEKAGNIKGRDFGYALAIRSCEGVNSVESCTITALDVITAFAVQTPTPPRRASRFFSGLLVLRVAPPNGSLSLLRIDSVYLINPFDRRRRAR